MKRLIIFIGVLISLLCLSSCSQDEDISIQNQNDFIVTFDEAKQFAEAHFVKTNRSNLSLRSDGFGESTTFNGEGDLPGLHVFNYDNGNEKFFVIIAGDERVPPILAHGNNEFPLDTLPFGVSDWMIHEIQYIDSIRLTEKVQDDYIKDFWEGRRLPIGYDCCEECPNWPDCQYDPVGCGDETINCNGVTDDNPCGDNTYFQYGPLLDTEWGQGCVYNELCPEEPTLPWGGGIPACGGDLPCNHVRTGCVATAMAQVINYFEHPNSFNYATLLSRYTSADFGASGADEVAQLMIDAAESVDMDWGCNASGSDTGDVNDALEDDFGYADGGDYGDYGSSGPVKQNIRWNKPVIFAGCREKVTFIFTWGYKGCHAWVCDGYKGHSNLCYSYLFYNMNWGWNNLHNGWYSHSSWSPGSRNYQYNKRVLLNINP